LPTCGTVPVSDGAARSVVAASLSGPAKAQSGSTVSMTVELRSLTGKVEPFVTGQPFDLLITRGADVVGRYEGAVAGTGLELAVPAAGALAVGHPVDGSHDDFAAVLLSGCPAGVDMAKPDATRRPLPPGGYQLVAVLEDDTTSGDEAHLVSAPYPLTVTAH